MTDHITYPGKLSVPEGKLLDSLPVAVYMCDHLGFISSFNQAAVELWGSKPVIGRDRWSGCDHMYYPDGTPLPLDDCPMARALQSGKPITEVEIIIVRPDGSRISVVPHAVPFFDHLGKVAGAVNTLIDVTGSQEHESKEAVLAAIITSSDDAIISKNLDGIINSWNEAAERMYGYTENEAIGQHITLIIPQDRLDEETHIINSIKSGARVEHFETLRQTKTGELVPVSLTISPVKDSKGKIIGASKIARDITRLKKAEEILKNYAEKLEILNGIGGVVSENLDVNKILQSVTDITTKLTGAAFGAFFYNVTDEKGESYMLYALSGAPREAFENLACRATRMFFAIPSRARVL